MRSLRSEPSVDGTSPGATYPNPLDKGGKREKALHRKSIQDIRLS